MSDYDAARPSEGKGQTKKVVTFWAELWRPMEKNSHGEALISPSFGTEPDCVAWVRQRRQKFTQISMWKRVSRNGNDYEDFSLETEEAPLADSARLHELIGVRRKKLTQP